MLDFFEKLYLIYLEITFCYSTNIHMVLYEYFFFLTKLDIIDKFNL